MRRFLSVAIVIFFAGLGAEAYARALQPLLVVGSACEAGSVRSHKYCVFEDRNGDGTYDFIVFGDCDGTTRGREWKANSDPFIPSNEDVYLGSLPNDVAYGTPDFSYNEEPNGLYSWTITEQAISPGGGGNICRIGRDAEGVLGMNCTPDGGGEELE